MLSGVSFLQMPPIDTYVGGSVLSDDYWRMSGPPAALALADLNGDRRLDIVTIGPNRSTDPYYPSHQLLWYQNNGGSTPTFTEHQLFPFGSLPSYDIVDVTSVAAMDVNGDGRTDLVITYTKTNLMMAGMAIGYWEQSLGWLENTGNPSAPFVLHFIGYEGGDLLSIQDVNGDGRPDIVVAGYDGMNPMLPRTWWDNVAGNGTVWAEHPLAGQGNDPSWATGDLNGDGYVDSVRLIHPIWQRQGGQSYWVDNQAPGQPAITHFINANTGGTTWPDVAVGDLNGDGRPDIVFLSSNQLGWLENVPGPVTLATTNTAPSTLNPGQAASVLRLDVTNSGLTTIDFRSVALFLAEPAGLTNSSPANLTASVSIYRDNGSGQFNSADPVLGSVTNVSLVSTQLQVQLNASSSSARLSVGASTSFFVVIQLASTTSMQSQGFQVTWVPQGTSLVDEATGLGLAFESPGNLTSSLVLVP
jgi:hypothetical protein